jgi:hypothetical protein
MSSKMGKNSYRKSRKWSTRRFMEEFTMDRKTKRKLKWTIITGIVIGVAGGILGSYSAIFTVLAGIGGALAVGAFGILLIMNEKRIILNISILIVLLLLGIQMKRWHWPGAGITITLALVSMAMGYFFMAFNNLYTIKNNRYLRIVSTIASFFLFIMALGTVFKFQHWPGAGIMIQISLLPSIIFTMIVLVTLPGSSYIQWEKKHKILFSKKLLIPWIFFMLFTASVLLLPRNITRQLFSADSDAKAPFAMKTYDIEQKDGLEQPDQ